MTTRRSIGIAAAVAAALMLLTPTANAMGGGGGGAAVVLDSVQFFDLRGGKTRIEILGRGFSNGTFPNVTLDGVIALDVLDASPEISALELQLQIRAPIIWKMARVGIPPRMKWFEQS